MPTVLSTKKLSLAQKELLLNSKLNFVETDSIKIEHIEYKISDEIDHLIFTSKHAVKSYTKKEKSDRRKKIKAFCVGQKTKNLLERYNIFVELQTENAVELAENIVNKYAHLHFLYLSGNRRRPELTDRLKKYNVRYNEVVVYKTFLKPKKFERYFDGVLFFSPSGVESFVMENKLRGTIAFCIGATTASEAKKYTDKIILSNKQTIENVIVQAVKHFGSRRSLC